MKAAQHLDFNRDDIFNKKRTVLQDKVYLVPILYKLLNTLTLTGRELI